MRIVGRNSVNDAESRLSVEPEPTQQEPDNLSVLPNDHRDITHLRRTCQPDWRRRFTQAMANTAKCLDFRAISRGRIFSEKTRTASSLLSTSCDLCDVDRATTEGLEANAYSTRPACPPLIPLVYAAFRVEYLAYVPSVECMNCSSTSLE